MKRFKDISFVNKLHAVIIGTTVVALLLFASAVIVYEVITYRTSTVAKIQTVADIISNSVAPALLFDDSDYGKRLLRTLSEEPHIAIAAFYRADGSLFADYYRDPLPKSTQLPFNQREGFYFSANHVEVYHSVQSEGGGLGTLYIRYDLKEMQARFKQYTVIILIVLITSFVVASVIASRMERIITSPILHLAQVASKIAREKDYSVRVEKQWGDDEVGTLVSGFNQMLARIEARDRALAASEERFRGMADNIPSGIVIVEEGKVVYVNDQACQICGYPREELLSIWGPDLAAPQELEKKEQIVHRVRETGTCPEQIDTWIIRKDGTERCVNLRFSFSQLRERNYVGYVVITDITDRKHAENTLLETRDFLSNIIDTSLDPIVIGDNRGNITRVNKAFINLVGFDRNELNGKHMAELVPPREGLYESTDGSTSRVEESFYDRAYEQMCTLIEKGSLSDWECCYFRKDGKLVPVEQTMFYIYNSKGDRIGVVAINRDISERKNAEKKLFEAKNFLDDIIRTSADGIIVSDTLGTITLVNDAAQRLLGYSKDEFLGKNVHDFMVISCEAREVDFRKTSFNPLDSVYYYEATWAAQGGRLVDLEMSMGILRDVTGNMTGMVSCIRDITERKAWEKRLFEYQEQLRSLTSQLTLTEEQERKRIAAEIHDSISQSLALAKIKLGTLMQAVSSTAAQDVAAVRSLLDQSIREARSLMFDLSPPFLYEFGLKKALEWVLEDMEKQHGIKTRLAWNGNEEIYDDVRIIFYQSIRELLINVVKHAQATTATVMVSKDDKWMRVRIEDDGKGFLVSPEGFKVSAQGGYGLFSISERFQHLGGALTVESKLSLGTTVDLELPLVQHTA